MARGRLVALVLVGAVMLGGCGDGQQKPNATASTTSTTTPATTGPLPYVVFEANGWSLTDAMDQPLPVEDPFRLKWSVSYTNWPSPNVQRNAALAVADPSFGDANQTASLLGESRKIELAARVAYVVEEMGTDGHLISTHVMWDLDGYIAWLTLYDTAAAEAEKLAANVRAVTKEQWYQAMSAELAENVTSG